MSNKKPNTESGASRWLRIVVLTLSMLTPVINLVVSRLRAQAEAVRLEEAQSRAQRALAQGQEQLRAASASVADRLSDLKEHPYTQQLLKRGSDLTDRGSALAQILADRGSDLTGTLSKRSQDWRARGSQATKQIAKQARRTAEDLSDRSELLTKQLARRTRRTVEDLSERGSELAKEAAKRTRRTAEDLRERRSASSMWTIAGFGVGLLAAATAAYLFIRRRIWQQAVESELYRVPQQENLNAAPSVATLPVTDTASTDVNTEIPPAVIQQADAALVQPAVQDELALENASAQTEALPRQDATQPAAEPFQDAAFIGITSTRRYFPIETPLDQLDSPQNGNLEIIYFITEDEAKAQGFVR